MVRYVADKLLLQMVAKALDASSKINLSYVELLMLSLAV